MTTKRSSQALRSDPVYFEQTLATITSLLSTAINEADLAWDTAPDWGYRGSVTNLEQHLAEAHRIAAELLAIAR
jgi:hypothetical protein